MEFHSLSVCNHLLLYIELTATTLTSWHLLVTFCSLHVALWMKFFEHKPFDPRAVLGFGVLNGISIGLLNLSLGFNSVGFYQVQPLFLFCRSSCCWMWYRVLNLVLVYMSSLPLISDDKTCNHPLYCCLRDHLLQKDVQVSTDIV